MSYLSYPQINFQGTAYCNASTGDNNDFAYVFDIDTLELANPMTVIKDAEVMHPAGEQQFKYQGPQDSPGARTWLMGLMTNIKPEEGGPYGQQAHWNYYGDHATRLDNASVITFFDSNGKPGVVTDPLNAATVKLIGTPSPMQLKDPVIVDNDPYALITSQIFSHGFTVTGLDGTSLISASPTARSYAYYINGNKNIDPLCTGFQGVSAIFITSVPSGPDLVINTSAGSPAINDLAAAVAKGAGLQMRFIFYNAIYQIDPQTLYNKFKKGDFKDASNPYIGKALGTIGVLSQGDMLSAPPGRKLNKQIPFSYNPNSPCAPGAGQAARLGITLARIDPDSETAFVDTISTFPECNRITNTKFNFGPQVMSLLLKTPEPGAPITIGTIPNTQQGYQATAGMVAIPFSNNPKRAEIKANATRGTLSIVDWNSQIELLVERPGVSVFTESRGVYFDVQVLDNWGDQNEQPRAGTATVTIKAFQNGVPVQQATPINLEYWMCAKGRDQIDPSKPQVPVPSTPVDLRYFTVSGAIPQQRTQYDNAPGNKGTIYVLTDQVTIPANSNGELTLTLSGVNSGTSIMRFRDASIPAYPPNFLWDNVDYCCVRILPFDDYRGYNNQQINNWAFMYENFFNYFALLYPVMSKVIPWGPLDAPDNPETVAKFASQMRLFTRPQIWNTTLYMPITRDLSAGKRALLWRWCNLQTS